MGPDPIWPHMAPTWYSAVQDHIDVGKALLPRLAPFGRDIYILKTRFAQDSTGPVIAFKDTGDDGRSI